MIIILVIIGISLLILGHEAGHFVFAKLFGMRVDEFGFGFGKKLIGKKIGETEYRINLVPLGGYVKIAGEEDRMTGALIEKVATMPEAEKKRLFFLQPAWKRGIMIFAGVFINFIMGWFLFSAVLAAGTPPALVIEAVAPASPAFQSGAVAGDVIRGYTKIDDFTSFINSHLGSQITFTVDRNGMDVRVSGVPRVHPPAGEGSFGVALEEVGAPREGFFASIRDGFSESINAIVMTAEAFYALFKNLLVHQMLPAGVAGPIGIVTYAQGAAKVGIIYLLQILALISINLAVLNLLPWPPLDGSKLLFVLIEKIKGSPISQKVENVATGIGVALLLVLMAVITYRDIVHLL